MKMCGDLPNKSKNSMSCNLYHIQLALLQVIASAFVGVCNEKLLKQVKLPLNLQNLFLYTRHISQFLLSYQYSHATQLDFNFLTYPVLWMLIGLIACVRIITSLFLKIDSVQKALASALELAFLPLLRWFFFQIPLTLHLLKSIFFVYLGVYWFDQPTPTKHLPK